MAGRIAPIPLIEIHEVVVVVLEVERAHAGQVDLDGTRQIRQPRTVVGRGQKEHPTALLHHLQPLRGELGIGRAAQNAFHQEATQAVGDETQRPLPDACAHQPVQGVFSPTRERHRCPRIGIFAPKEWDALPLAGGSGIAQRPHPNLGSKLQGQPVGPRGVFIRSAAPGRYGIAAEAMDEHHIQLAFRRKG